MSVVFILLTATVTTHITSVTAVCYKMFLQTIHKIFKIYSGLKKEKWIHVLKGCCNKSFYYEFRFFNSKLKDSIISCIWNIFDPSIGLICQLMKIRCSKLHQTEQTSSCCRQFLFLANISTWTREHNENQLIFRQSQSSFANFVHDTW